MQLNMNMKLVLLHILCYEIGNGTQQGISTNEVTNIKH
jgi:hypothetical protein